MPAAGASHKKRRVKSPTPKMLLPIQMASAAGLIGQPKTKHINAKVQPRLFEAASKRAGSSSPAVVIEAALAALAMQDPDGATRELQRCVKELGFVGALVNGFSQINDPNSMVYLDDRRYAGFWAECEKLDLPFYLHPRNPLPSAAQIYEGHPWLLGPTWAFGQETAVHALRLMASGIFDRHPKLQIILGHLGEGLPYSIWRVDNRNAWTKAPPRYPAKKKLGVYFQENFHLTTSGNFRTQTLIDAMLEIGSDRIMFSTDWPFENVDHAAIWFDACSISEADREKIGRTNAARLFKLKL